MPSSGPGATVAGAGTSLSPQDPNGRHEAAHSRQQLGSGSLGAGQRPHPSSLESNNWFYAAQQLPTSTLPQHPVTGSSVSSSMIGPTSTFYDPNNSLQPQTDADSHPYQQWINTYNEQQNYGREVNPYPNFLHGYSPTQYAGSIADTITPSATNLYRQPSQQDDLYTSYYTSELLNATGSVTATTASTPDSRQAYQHPTPDPTLHSYANTPDPAQSQEQSQAYQDQNPHQLVQRSAHSPRRTEQVPSQQNQHTQQQFRAHSRQQPSPSHHQQPLEPQRPQAIPQQYQRTSSGSPLDHQHPPLAQPYSQQAPNTNDSNSSNPRKQLQGDTRPPGLYTTNQLNIQHYKPKPQTPSGSPTSATATRPDQTRVNASSGDAPPEREGIVSSGGTSQVARNPQKSGPAGGTPKRPASNTNGTAQPHQGTPTPSDNSNPRKRKRGKRGGSGGYWAAGDGESEDESEEEEGEGFSGGISVGMAGLGVVSADGRHEKGSRLCVSFVSCFFFF
ncbi:hypothetical protein P691DRAFT_416210 [Macrolepiota fuliginosa MF-IS2]|uniref:Uncharacterized protein n=1 Tax=Macrolepiota fuliginosa MF-IS2 TaxID=1400762 RepID=A0A9P5X2G8_9AGAR|nr:hypothetical protein P691DRAFT_416210 [Macrolepiota fuliginosa MF-IS2]